MTFFKLGFLIQFWTWNLTLLSVVLPLVNILLFSRWNEMENFISCAVYVKHHNVDEIITFAKDYLQKQRRRSVLKKCFCLDDFLQSNRRKDIHNFIRHYERGKSMSYEQKPINIERSGGVQSYSFVLWKYW